MPPASAAVNARSCFAAWLTAGFLLVATVVAYQPVWQAGFIWDDDAMLTANPLVKAGGQGLLDIWVTSKFHDYVPLTLTTLWLEWHLWGDRPLGYHLVNVLLHALSAVLLWRVLIRLRIPGAPLAAAIFALHPVNVESVAWIAERKNTLAMFFYLLSLLAYLRSEAGPAAPNARQGLWYGLALGAFLLALTSKTAVAPLPLVLLGLAWWQRGRVEVKDVLRTLPFFALTAAASLVALWFQYSRAIGASLLDVRSGSLWSRLAGAGWAIWFYLYKAVWPLNLSFVYPRWQVDPAGPLAYLPGLLLVLAFVLCWRFRQSWGRPGLFALGYFVLLLLPVLGFVNIYFMRFSLVSDHWQYFAIIGPIALIAGALTAGMKRLGQANRVLQLAPGAVILLALGGLSWKQARIYADQETLWRDTIAANPACWMAHNNLGNIFTDKGRIDEALREYEEVIRLQPDNADAHNNLGTCLTRKGQTDAAIRQFQEALSLQSDNANAHFNLGAALDQKGQADEAIRHYRESLRIKANNPNGHFNLGTALLAKGQLDEAISQLQEAVRLQPDNADARNNLGAALSMKGRIEEAVSQFREVVRLKPDDPDAKANLAKAMGLARKSKPPLPNPAQR
jgi:protein O-mannosyl-transferase